MIIKPLNRHLLQREGVLALLLITFAGGFAFLRPGNPHSADVIEQLLHLCMGVMSALLALPIFLPEAHRPRQRPASLLKEMVCPNRPQQWVPLLLLFAIMCHTSGRFFLLYAAVMNIPFPFPSPTDFVCLFALVPLLLAIVLLPSRQFPTEKRLNIVLDGMMITVGVVTFSWYFMLGPAILQLAMTNPLQIFVIVYTLDALFLTFSFLLLLLRANNQTLRSVGGPLSAGIASLALSSSILNYGLLHQIPQLVTLAPLGYSLGYLLIGLATRTLHISGYSTGGSAMVPAVREQEPGEESVSLLLWRPLLPYAIIPPTILLLVLTSYVGGNSALEPGVYLGALTLVGLLVIRQIFTVRAMVTQNWVLGLMQQELRETNNALRQANGQLEQANGQLEQANDQLAHLHRLRNQFIVNVNHELRVPLTQIDGYLELLSEYQGRLDEQTQTTFLKHARNGSQELIVMVNNLLDALRVESEVEPPQMEQMALCSVVREVCDQFPPEGEQESRLQMEVAPCLVINADQRYLRQILRNLVSNALKYSPPRTPVSIRAQLVEQAGTSRICINVQDAGPGIPPEERALLFQKFARLKRDVSSSVQGTGIGLYMCKQLVEAMKGEIWVESSGKEGEGSRFCFTLACQEKNTHGATYMVGQE